VTAFEGNGRVRGVITTQGRLPADMVILAIGVRRHSYAPSRFAHWQARLRAAGFQVQHFTAHHEVRARPRFAR